MVLWVPAYTGDIRKGMGVEFWVVLRVNLKWMETGSNLRCGKEACAAEGCHCK